MKSSGPGFFFVGRLLIIALISLLVIGLFRLFISYDFYVGQLVGIHNFFPGYSISRYIIVNSSLL